MQIYVSASGISDFLLCNRKLYYRIYKPIERPVSSAASKGILVHKALETCWDDVLKAYNYIENNYKLHGLSEDSVPELNSLVHKFFENFYNYVGEKDLIEHNFRISLLPNVSLVGVFDRISNGNVFDWKTSKGKTPKTLESNIQFILYNYAYKKLFNSPPHGLYYASLRTGDLVMYNENEEFTSILFDEIIPEYVKSVSNQRFPKIGIYNNSCFKCDWREHCLKQSR